MCYSWTPLIPMALKATPCFPGYCEGFAADTCSYTDIFLAGRECTIFGKKKQFSFAVAKMSGLSKTERAGCTNILKLMSKDNLLSLTDTVTNKMIVVENTAGIVCFHRYLLARSKIESIALWSTFVNNNNINYFVYLHLSLT